MPKYLIFLVKKVLLFKIVGKTLYTITYIYYSMILEINYMWLVPLIFLPFILGLFAGLRTMKQKIVMHLLEKLSVDEFEKLMEIE